MNKPAPIYLDHNATTPVHPGVVAAMLPYFTEHFGNPDSRSHAYGWHAKAACDVARASLLKSLQAPANAKLIFTASATESNNLAIQGVVAAAGAKSHIITQTTEHACVLATCRALEKQGHRVTYLDVDAEGFVRPADLKKALTPTTLLVSLMGANNEIGTIQPISELLNVTKQNSKAFFHSDLTQMAGREPLSLLSWPLDLASFSSHKLYGPKGVAALYLAPSLRPSQLQAQMHGGGHEDGLRSGTLNVPGIVGLARAFEIATADLPEEHARLTALRDAFIAGLLAIPGVVLNGPRGLRLCNNINVTIASVPAESLLLAVPELAFSTGSACASGKAEPSYVIQALGQSASQAKSTVRFGLGRATTRADVQKALQLLKSAILRLRGELTIATK